MTPEEFLQRHAAKMEWQGPCLIWIGALSSGYGRVRYKGVNRAAHRVMYELTHGVLTQGFDVDHICHNRACVNIDHLRAATRAENLRYRQGARRDSASGVRNVHWDATRNKWQASVRLNGKPLHLGRFLDIEDAKAAVRAARARYYGEFAGKG